MAVAQIFLDTNYEQCIIRRKGRDDIVGYVRDEESAERFARANGFAVIGEWHLMSRINHENAWECAMVVPSYPARKAA